jgi:hypothetical protein
MNKELRSELETQGHLLETTRADMETFKVAKSATGGGEQSFKMLRVPIVALQVSNAEERSFVSGKISPKLKAEKKG